MSGGGGGTSGKVEFVQYIEDIHENWLIGSTSGVVGSGNPDEDMDNSIVALMNQAMAGGSPFYGAEFTDPDSDMQAVEDAVGVPASDMFTLAEALNNITDWDAIVANAKTKADSNITNSFIGTLITAILARVNWGTIIDATKTKADSVITDTYIATLVTAVLSRVSWDTIIDATKTKADSVITDTYIGTLMTVILARVDWATNFDAILAKYDATFDDDEVDAKVEAFEKKTTLEHQRAVARMAAGMSDINAITGSGYVIGLSLMERERRDKLGEYRADILLQLRKDKVEFLKDQVKAYNTVLLSASELQARLRDAYQGNWQNFMQVGAELDTKAKLEVTRLQAMLRDGYEKNWQNFMETGARLDTMGKLETSKFESLLTDSYQGRWQDYQTRGAELMGTMLQFNKDYIKIVTDQMAETRRMKVVALHEYEARELDLDVQDALYDIKIYEHGAGLLGAPSGMAAALPEKDSIGRSAFGGVLAGAGAGAYIGGKIGAAGGPIGVAGGAAIGALLGIGQAFL